MRMFTWSKADKTQPTVPSPPQAKNLKINRTVHAGEDGPSVNVKIAVEEMFAQRIGHGYRVMQDPELYRKCR